MKAKKFLIAILVCIVLSMFTGLVVVPAITGKTLIDIINPPRGGNVYVFTIKDVNGDTLEVEVSDFNVLEQAKQMKELGESKWVGGKLVLYDNEWGFRFDPDTITIAEVTAEGLQATLQGINGDLDYWLQFNRVYVSAEVIEVGVEHGIGRE